jgi:hypothetical protein
MFKGTQALKPKKILAVLVIVAAGLTVSACDNMNDPSTPGTPKFDSPTFTPAPLVSKRPDSDKSQNVNSDSSNDNETDEVSYPAPAVKPDADTSAG